MIVLGEHYVTSHPLDFVRHEAREWSMSGRAARSIAPGCDVLCFGSSMSTFAVIPSVFERVTGLKAYNLAVCSGPPPAAENLLRQALNAGAQPKALLVEMHPNSLSDNPRESLYLYPELLSIRESAVLAREARDSWIFTAIIANKVLASLHSRDQIRSAVVSALRAERTHVRLKNLMVLRNKRLNSGALLLPESDFDGKIGPAFDKLLRDEPWKPTRSSAASIRRFLDLAKSRNIPVFWHIPPFCPEMTTARAKRGLDAAYARHMCRLQTLYPNVTVVNAQNSGFGTELFADPVHMTRRGAVAYTESLAKAVVEGLNGEDSRWVTLPPYRPMIDDSLEDMKQSALAVPATLLR